MFVCFGAALAAQCPLSWISEGPLAGTDGVVNAMVRWDPDGAGPLGPRIVLGGDFAAAGTAVARDLAMFDPATGVWSGFGSGVTNGVNNARVESLSVTASGALLVGGVFAAVDGVAATGVALFDGAWHSLGTFTGVVEAVLGRSNGDILVAHNGLKLWDGTTWSTITLPFFNGAILAMAEAPNGDVVVVGTFQSTASWPFSGVARWDGTSWSGFGTGLTGSLPFNPSKGGYTVLVEPSGDVIVGGNFTSAGGVPASCLARWSGGGWTAIGDTDREVQSLAFASNGDLLAGGQFQSIGGQTIARLARNNAGFWSGFGMPAPPIVAVSTTSVRAIEPLPNGRFLAAGDFPGAGTARTRNVALFDGVQLTAPTPGTDGKVAAMAALPNGDVVASGDFTSFRGVPCDGLVRRSPSGSWTALSPGPLLGVAAMAPTANGDLLLVGPIATPLTVSTTLVRSSNGVPTVIASVDPGGRLGEPLELDDGSIVVCGFGTLAGLPLSRVLRYDGTSWSALGFVSEGGTGALAKLPGGGLLAGGSRSLQSTLVSNVARWDGSSWQSLGVGTPVAGSAIIDLAVLADGTPVAIGEWSPNAFGVARFDGVAWQTMGGAFFFGQGLDAPTTLLPLPDNDLLVGGAFDRIGTTSASRVARWDGQAWSAIGSGLDGPAYSQALAMVMAANGQVFVGGSFDGIGGQASASVARLQTACPATAQRSGFGCAGSGGIAALDGVTLPWVDATFRARGTNLPNRAIVLAATGFTSIPQGVAPLSSFFPQGTLAGCDLLVDPEIVEMLVTTTGVVDSALFVPSSPAIVGVVFHHQMIPFEIDTLPSIVSITATNALRLTAGQL